MNTTDENSPLNSKDVQRRFDRAASRFDSVDFVSSTTRDGLFSRLEAMLVEPRTIVDLGAATGSSIRLLNRRFRGAHIIATDLSGQMLEKVQTKRSWFSRTSAVQADAGSLPFADQSIDVVFANLLLPWVDNPVLVFAEVARVLRNNGLFLFSTLGPDSLSELRQAWGDVDPDQHVRRFPDMHDIGDVAVRAGLRDPVLDVDRLAVTYRGAEALFEDLTAMGARNSLQHRSRSLGGVTRFKEMASALDAMRTDGLLTFDLELIYGHCWGPGARSPAGEFRIDPKRISRRTR
ncbi:MAG: methyltransferase domain-containing protein [Gammaproteobacteria bacterium]|nr:methyltransferase domain-containing protein [Gammaproteobacteria bacterium]MDH3409385.1 methyltransferase domain-containing protein [Gammaproteobacteria bacterium]MDH3552201.1 methyltransferase domain-containing protein [Gammaproteobacteria bacterium]